MATASVLPSGGTTACSWSARPRSRRSRHWPRRRGAAAGGSSSSRAAPASARPACSPRRARSPARRGCGCSPPAAASSRASLRTGSSGSCSSRCSRPRLRISARSCSQGLPRSSSRCSEPRGPPLLRTRAAEGSFAILHGLYWLAANVALQQPTLLAIDDLHWADTPSLRWLLYLTRRLEGVPLLVAAATRPPEGEGRDPTLVAELIADPEAAAIRPEPLGRASIAVLARELHGLEPDEAFCAALETATGGNPLFVRRGARRGRAGGNQPDRRAGAPSARNRSAGRFSRRRASPRSPAAGGACPPPRGLDPRRRGRAAPRGRARRRGSRRAWSGRRRARSARPAPARGSARVLPPRRPQRRLRDARCRRARRRAPLGR